MNHDDYCDQVAERSDQARGACAAIAAEATHSVTYMNSGNGKRNQRPKQTHMVVGKLKMVTFLFVPSHNFIKYLCRYVEKVPNYQYWSSLKPIKVDKLRSQGIFENFDRGLLLFYTCLAKTATIVGRRLQTKLFYINIKVNQSLR